MLLSNVEYKKKKKKKKKKGGNNKKKKFLNTGFFPPSHDENETLLSHNPINQVRNEKKKD